MLHNIAPFRGATRMPANLFCANAHCLVTFGSACAYGNGHIPIVTAELPCLKIYRFSEAPATFAGKLHQRVHGVTATKRHACHGPLTCGASSTANTGLATVAADIQTKWPAWSQNACRRLSQVCPAALLCTTPGLPAKDGQCGAGRQGPRSPWPFPS